MDNEIDRKIDVTAMQFLLVQNRQKTHDWTLIGSGANGLGILEWSISFFNDCAKEEVAENYEKMISVWFPTVVSEVLSSVGNPVVNR